MTISAKPTMSARLRGMSWQRLAAVFLCALAILAIFLNFSAGDPLKGEVSSRYTGIDFLLGRVAGKSAGTPHPLLIAVIAALALMLIFVLRFRTKRNMPAILLGVAVACALLFRFDVVYSAKAEFDMVDGSVRFGIGFLSMLGSILCAFILIVVDNVHYSRAQSRAQIEAIYAKGTLPEGYHVRSTGEIILNDFRKHWPVYLLILPTIIYYLVWAYGPMYGIVIAFNDFNIRKGMLGSDWAGLRWFREFFRSPYAYRTIRNTLFLNVLNLLIGFPLPIVLALMLNEMRSLRYKRVVQTITYMPYFVSLVVLCGILKDFTSTDGLFGTLMGQMGLTPVNLLGDSRYFRSVYISSELWQRLGWDSIIFLSALSAIDQEQYEAAVIDGASRWKQTLHVTLPGIMPTIAILLVLRIGSMMSIGYEKLILMYNGLTYETADVVSTYVYRRGIEEASFSFSTAVSLFNSIINFLLVILANRASAVLTETSLW